MNMQLFPGAAIGVILKNGKILIEQHEMDSSSYSGSYTLPGGHIEKGESVEETLIRELDEELNIVPTKFQLLCILPRYNKEGKVVYECYFLITNFKGKIKKKTAFRLFWIKPSDYKMLDAKTDREAVKILYKKRKLPFISKKITCQCPNLDFRSKIASIKCEKGRHSIIISNKIKNNISNIKIPLIDKKLPSAGMFMGECLTKLKEIENKNIKFKTGLELGSGKYAPASFYALASFPELKIDAIEINAEEAAYLKKIIKLNGLEKRFKVYIGNLFKPIEKRNKKYDIIFSNISQLPLPKNIKEKTHDHGGNDGWKYLSKIIEESSKYLKNHGYLVLEVFNFLGIKRRTNPKIPCLFERLKNNNFIPKKIFSFRRKMRWGGETHKALEHIVKLYPKAKFYDSYGNIINPLKNAKNGLEIFIEFNVVISKLSGKNG